MQHASSRVIYTDYNSLNNTNFINIFLLLLFYNKENIFLTVMPYQITQALA